MSEPPSSHGDVTAEYLALVRGAALVSGRHELLWVRGPDTARFLDGLLSQRVEGEPAGTVSRSLLLAPNGKLRAVLHLLIGDDAVGLVTDRGVGEAVAADLNRFKLRVDVRIEPETGELLEVWGPDTPALLDRAGLEMPAGWSADPVVAALPFTGATMPRVLLVDADRDGLITAGAVPAGSDAVDAVRIELGEPVVGRDVDDKTIPQETNLVPDAVDFAKGCYLGQELVARIDSRGHVNRHLRGLVLTGNVRPPLGAVVVAGEAPVGTVTSLAESLDLRAPVGLAMVRREVEPGTTVEIRWDGGAAGAVVHSLPLR